MTATLQAVSLAVDLLSAVSELTLKLQTVNALLQKAHSEGRELTQAELDSVASLDDEARAKLAKAIGAI